MAQNFKIAGFALVDFFEGENLKKLGTCLHKNNVIPIVIGLKKGRNVVDKDRTMMTETDLTFARARTQIDALVLADDYSVEQLMSHGPFNKLIEKMVQADQLVVAFGEAPIMLAQAGVISGRKVTSSPKITKKLEKAGANVVDKKVVVDNNLITAQTMDQAAAVCNKMVEKLMKKAA